VARAVALRQCGITQRKRCRQAGARHRVVISAETVRVILREAGISWQATKTWKGSKDLDFTAKMARILALYDRHPVDGRVICVDESGHSTCNRGRVGLVSPRAGGPVAGHRGHDTRARCPVRPFTPTTGAVHP
jgi:hypothetical protein